MATYVIAAALVLAAAIIALAWVIVTSRQAAPSRELATAVRLLDRIIAYDDAVSSLSQELRAEAREFTRRFYKELP